MQIEFERADRLECPSLTNTCTRVSANDTRNEDARRESEQHTQRRVKTASRP